MNSQSLKENPAQADFPLFGEKILLRLFMPEDITPAYVNWLNDPEVIRYSNQRFLYHTQDSCKQYLASFAKTDNLFLSVRRRIDDEAVGTMTAYVNRHHGTVDVGIMIGYRAVWGQGYGQDAWNTLCDWLLARKSIRKLTAGTLACNFGMVRIMERAGMQCEAVRKAQELVDDQPVDIVYYAKFSES